MDNVKNTEALLPCPCCGCNARLMESVETWVECTQCQTQTRTFNFASTAISTWNTRAAAMVKPEVSGWQDIKDIPEAVKQKVMDIELCMFKKGDLPSNTHYVVKVCHWEYRTKTWRISGTREDMRNPTHYRYLPAAPQAAQPAQGKSE